jgi:putative inorganic carbon (HCO3(-)) transporter
MRDLLLAATLLGASSFALLHTWIGVLLWTWLSIMNPHRLAFGFARDAPFAAMVAGVVLLSLVITRDKLRMPWAPPVKVLFIFVVWMCLTTAFAMNPVDSWSQLEKVLKIQLMTAIALMALHERKHIELFVWINVLSVGFFGFKGGIHTITTGGGQKVWGPSGSFIEDNNALAVAIVMIIPLLNYLRIVAPRRFIRFGLLALMLLCALSVLGSQSRGALLAISAMALVLWYRSDRKLMGGMLIIAVGRGSLSDGENLGLAVLY